MEEVAWPYDLEVLHLMVGCASRIVASRGALGYSLDAKHRLT
jgi:hypothetical protein